MLKKFFIILNFLCILFTIMPFENTCISKFTFSSNKSLGASTSIRNSPSINARHAIILDRNSKQILYGKKETESCKMASTTKIMTAIIVIENANLQDIVTISSNAAETRGSRLGLSYNDLITVENLLYGLMMHSGNDAAVALAEHIGNTVENFAKLMNDKATNLGLYSTHFVTPHGLDNENHFSSAYDLAILTDYALSNEIFAKIVQTKTYTITINNSPKTLSNTNELLGNLEGIYGVKTGFTNGANRCLITSCKRDNFDIICVVLGCDTKKDRTRDSMNLINFAFNNFTVINVKDFIISDFQKWRTTYNNSFIINKGCTNLLELNINENNIPYSFVAINNTSLNDIHTSICFKSYLEAPVPTNSTVGTLSFLVNDIEYFRINILNTKEIYKKNILNYFSNLIFDYYRYLESAL